MPERSIVKRFLNALKSSGTAIDSPLEVHLGTVALIGTGHFVLQVALFVGGMHYQACRRLLQIVGFPIVPMISSIPSGPWSLLVHGPAAWLWFGMNSWLWAWFGYNIWSLVEKPEFRDEIRKLLTKRRSSDTPDDRT